MKQKIERFARQCGCGSETGARRRRVRKSDDVDSNAQWARVSDAKRASRNDRVHDARVLMHKVNLGLPVSGAPGNPIPPHVVRARRDERQRGERSKSERGRGEHERADEGVRERKTWSSLMDVWYPRFPFRPARTSRGRALLMGP